MKRVFPTQLKVVPDASDLIPAEEIRKGYYSERGRHAVHIAVRADKGQIIMSSPGVWYRSYHFSIDVPALIKYQAHQAGEDDDDEEDGEVGRAVYALWKLVAIVVKTECGRKAMYSEGARYITISHLTRNHTKQIYYLMKHVLTRMDIRFSVSGSWLAPSFHSADAPDVRERVRRRRKRKHEEPVVVDSLSAYNWTRK